MNHLTATYIDFVQSIGVLLIFIVAAYAQWSSESMLEDSMKRAIRYRDLTSL